MYIESASSTYTYYSQMVGTGPNNSTLKSFLRSNFYFLVSIYNLVRPIPRGPGHPCLLEGLVRREYSWKVIVKVLKSGSGTYTFLVRPLSQPSSLNSLDFVCVFVCFCSPVPSVIDADNKKKIKKLEHSLRRFTSTSFFLSLSLLSLLPTYSTFFYPRVRRLYCHPEKKKFVF